MRNNETGSAFLAIGRSGHQSTEAHRTSSSGRRQKRSGIHGIHVRNMHVRTYGHGIIITTQNNKQTHKTNAPGPRTTRFPSISAITIKHSAFTLRKKPKTTLTHAKKTPGCVDTPRKSIESSGISFRNPRMFRNNRQLYQGISVNQLCNS